MSAAIRFSVYSDASHPPAFGNYQKLLKPKGNTEKTPTTKKLQQVLKLFDEGKDTKEVARQLGFKSHLVLANYMKEKGYLWNHHTLRYEQQVGEIRNDTGEE